MSCPKDVNDLYRQDPDAFEANIMSRIGQAVPAREFVMQHPVKGSGALSVHSDDAPDARPSAFDLVRDRVSLDELLTPPEPRIFVIDGRLPQDAGTLVGPGGGNKTTVALWEGIHIILGTRLYGRDVSKPGGVTFLSQEDERAKLVWRASRIMEGMGLTRGEIERVAENLFVPDLSRNRLRLVETDGSGNLRRTDVVNELSDAYSGAGVSLVVFDPMIYFGPGERFANDGGGETMSAGRQIAHALNCCVEFISHTSMATARNKPDDSYSARGAAAISDNGRFTRNLWTFAEGDRDRFGDPPSGVTPDDIARKSVLVMTQPKLSDGPPVTENTWLLRDGWAFAHVPNEHRGPDQIMRDDVARLQNFLREQDITGSWHTQKTLEDNCQLIGIPRGRLRVSLAAAEARGWVSQIEIPRGHPFRKGGRTHRFIAGVAP